MHIAHSSACMRHAYICRCTSVADRLKILGKVFDFHFFEFGLITHACMHITHTAARTHALEHVTSAARSADVYAHAFLSIANLLCAFGLLERRVLLA